MLPLLGLLGPILSKLTDLIPDPEARAKAAAEAQAQLLQVLTTADQQQSDTNKVEAASGSVFVAGWRPFIGWVCGSGLAYSFIVAPLGTGLASMFAAKVTFPPLDTATLMELLLGMLGMGGMRTFEKLNGVQDTRLASAARK